MKVGITERGDAGLDFSWVEKLLPLNVIITKNLNDTIIKHLVNNKDKIILHMTCTGFGSTVIEPNVPNVEFTYSQIHKLIKEGFPVKQIVLRIDPIIPTKVGLNTVRKILEKFKDTKIRRVRYSFLDMYPHVKERFEKANVPVPYHTFCCPDYMKQNALKLFKEYESIYEFEACAEDTPHKLGCISQKDFNILNIREIVNPCGFQRTGCLCVAGKTELLTNRKRCTHGCLYCYWKD